MEDLIEVQQRVRSLENDIRSLDLKVQAVSESLNYIQNSEKKSEIDDEKISLLAKNLPFGDHPLEEIKDNHIAKLYVTVLLSIAMQGTEQTKIPDQLIFVQWILQQTKIKKRLSDLLVDVYKINDATYEELRKLPEDMKESLVVDMFIVSNLPGRRKGQEKAEINEYLLNLLSVIHMEVQKIKLLSAVARVVLCQKVDKKSSSKDIVNELGYELQKYSYYLLDDFQNGYEIIWKCPRSLINGEVNWRIKTGEEIAKNETIASVSKRKPGFRAEKIEIKMPKSGKVFYFRNNNIHYAVWVPVWSQDSKEKVKEWALKNDDPTNVNGKDKTVISPWL